KRQTSIAAVAGFLIVDDRRNTLCCIATGTSPYDSDRVHSNWFALSDHREENENQKMKTIFFSGVV
ncbi:hypothetical protein A2U01_0114181, partial [Trifolium medium]|nr:hypothetical protein [Trifolium medium]